MLRRALLVFGVAAMVCPPARAAEKQAAHGPVPTLHAVRTQATVTIDGRLDDEVWLRAPAGTDFTQRDPEKASRRRSAPSCASPTTTTRCTSAPDARPRAGPDPRSSSAATPTPRQTASRSSWIRTTII